MVQKEVPGTTLGYDLISLDADGGVRDQKDLAALIHRLTSDAKSITDVYFVIHGWNNDLSDARAAYEKWLTAVAEAFEPDGIPASVRLVCIHWPSKAWGEETAIGGGAVLGGTNGTVVSAEEAVERYADLLGAQDSGDLATIVDAAAHGFRQQTLTPSLRSAFLTLRDEIDVDAVEDGHTEERDWDPDEAWAAIREFDQQELGLDEGAGMAGLMGGDGGGLVLGMVRQLSFWRMKKRARVVGEKGAARVLSAVIDAVPGARVNLMGHSFGGIVVCAAIAESDAVTTSSPVQSLFLVQGAFSMWAFADSITVAGGVAGYFSKILTEHLVLGPILVTRSRHDHAVGTYYPLASRLARSVILAGDRKYGGIGSYGALGLKPAPVELTLAPNGQIGPLERGRLYNVEASDVIRNLKPIQGAHTDIAHVELARLAFAGATA